MSTRIRGISGAAERDGLDLRWKTASGVHLAVTGHPDWYLYNEIFVEGEYDAPIALALARLPSPAPLHVLDLGGNVGFFTLRLVDRLRRAHPEQPFRVTLVEGSPRLFREAQRRVLEANGLGAHVRLVHGLVGEREGSARLQEEDFHPRNTVSGTGSGTRVDYVDLETLLPPDAPVDLLKCDIEGSEERFAESYGALLRRVRTAVVELHPDLCDAGRTLRLFADAGLGEARKLREDPDTQVFLLTRPGEG